MQLNAEQTEIALKDHHANHQKSASTLTEIELAQVHRTFYSKDLTDFAYQKLLLGFLIS